MSHRTTYADVFLCAALGEEKYDALKRREKRMARSHRDEFSKATKAAAFQRAEGRCECGCGVKVIAGEVEYDHRVEVALGGDNSLENCMVMRAKCHRLKTSERAAPVAKSKRISERSMGLRKSSNPVPGSRNTKWKKKMDGSVERR